MLKSIIPPNKIRNIANGAIETDSSANARIRFMDLVTIIIFVCNHHSKCRRHIHFYKHRQLVDMLIDRLQRGFSANKHTVMQLNGYYLITNVHLAKWMRTTQASVNKWIKDGLIKPSKNSFTNLKFFDIDEVVDQLRKQKQ